MGYRSQVRAVIYGDGDKLQTLVTKQLLLGSDLFERFKDGLTRYHSTRQRYDDDATMEQTPDPETGARKIIWVTEDIEVLDLYGDSWKWHEDYPDVAAWEAFMLEAEEFDLSYEFVRIGEENEDIERRSNVLHDGDDMLGVTRTICDDIDKGEPCQSITG